MYTHTLRDGHPIPALGLGTANMSNSQAEIAVSEALRRGYRLFDTAKNYKNEEGVGRAVNRSGTDREEIFVASKVPGRDQGFESTIASCKGSLANMGLDYLDLYLIHWPNPSQDRYLETWQGLIELQKQGLVKSIGVSNFLPEYIDRLVQETGVTPAINQVELNPYFQQEELIAYHFEHAILTQSWAPLGRKTNLLETTTVQEMVQATGRTAAQIVLRWHLQKGLVPIPKTTATSRMDENLNVFGWELEPEHMKELGRLDTHSSGFGLNPKTHEEM